MSETIECINTENVLKPVAPLHLTEGERKKQRILDDIRRSSQDKYFVPLLEIHR